MTPDERQERNRERQRLLDWRTKPADQWRATVQRWVDAGIVTRVQGDEILSVQHGDARDTPLPTDDVTRAQECTTYGVLLAAALGSILFLSHYWERIGRGGHLSVALLVAGDALLIGAMFVALHGAGARRLAGIFWLIATVGVATSVSDLVWLRAAHGPRLLVVGLVVLLTSVLLWRNQDRPLQFLSAVTGFILALCGVATVARVHATATELALGVYGCSFALGVASLHKLRPALAAFVVAEIGCGVGCLALSFPHHLGGVVLGIVSSVLAVTLGVVLVRPLAIVLGAMGFFMFDIRLFSIYLKSSSAALGAGILGVIVVCVALSHAVHTAARDRREAQRHLPVSADEPLGFS